MLEVVRTVDRSKGLIMFCLGCTLFFIFFHCGTPKAQETETPEKPVDVGSSMLSEEKNNENGNNAYGFSELWSCLLYTSPSPRDLSTSRMPSSA